MNLKKFARIIGCEIIFLDMMLESFFVAGDLAYDVSTWKESYKESYFCYYQDYPNCKKQLTSSKSKGESVSSDKNIQAAVQIVNVYTSNEPETYRVVNAIMRGQSLPNLASKDDEKILFPFIDLLERSYNLLCTEYPMYHGKQSLVFRGQKFIPENIDLSYTFQSFLSTSTSIITAQRFANRKIVFQIKGVTGLALESFSAYPAENEVLVLPGLTIQISSHQKEFSEIKRSIDREKGSNDYPEVYVEGFVPSEPVTSYVSKGTILYGKHTFLLVFFAVACMTLE